jgi:hypothetical protein
MDKGYITVNTNIASDGEDTDFCLFCENKDGELVFDGNHRASFNDFCESGN